MNTVATPCIMAVPSMLMVAPIGTVNEATLFFTPILYSTVRRVTGMVAPELAVENANAAGSRIFFRKVSGLSEPSNLSSSG